MNDAQTQFIAVCPACSASLNVSFNKLGQHIAYPQCHHTFVAGEAFLPDNQRSSERPVVSPKQPNDPVDRIDAVCPHCNATLHVRRAYVGNDVRCKYCDEVFRVQAQVGTQISAELDQPDPRQKALQAEHEQLYVAHNLLQADHDRLKTECTGLHENLRGLTTEIEAIRAALGTIAPEEVGALADERQSLVEEVHRLRDEIHASLATQSERDQLVADRQRWESDLDLAHAERDLLARELSERDDQLEAARADHDRLSVERQTSSDAIEQLRLALAQRHETTHTEHAQLRSEMENLRRELGLAEQCHRRKWSGSVTKSAALGIVGSNDTSWQQRVKPTTQPSRFAGRTAECLTTRPPVLGIVSEECELQANPPSTGVLIAGGQRPNTADELESLRAQVAELGQRLDESELLHREMAEVLDGIGIHCRPTRA